MLTLFKTVPYYIQAMIIALLFVTPFAVSNEIYNGLIVAKEFWFTGVVVLVLLYGGIALLFTKQRLKVNLNLPDILLLAFYAWCFARACYTTYTPFYYNHKLQMLTGGLVVYFFIKRTLQRNENHSFKHLSIQSFSHSSIQSLSHSPFHTFNHFSIQNSMYFPVNLRTSVIFCNSLRAMFVTLKSSIFFVHNMKAVKHYTKNSLTKLYPLII